MWFPQGLGFQNAQKPAGCGAAQAKGGSRDTTKQGQALKDFAGVVEEEEEEEVVLISSHFDEVIVYFDFEVLQRSRQQLDPNPRAVLFSNRVLGGVCKCPI